MSAADFAGLIRTLSAAGVEYVIIGGIAATIHGSAYMTNDLDIVYRRAPENLARLVTALAPFQPYLRGAPPGLPFQFDVATLQRGLNFTLQTALGDIDLLGEVTGGGTYDQLQTHSESAVVFGCEVMCVTLRQLVVLKRAAGRHKDLLVLGELEALLEERDRGQS